MNNCTTYNYTSENSFNFTGPTTEGESNLNPLIPGLTKELFDTVRSDGNFLPMVNSSFICSKISPLINAGNNSSVLDIPYDIIKNKRIYLNDIVDIGPYEIIVNNKILFENDVESIFQSKIEKISATRYYITEKELMLKDFFEGLSQDEIDTFIKEEKIFIKLKNIEIKNIISDKPDYLIDTFDAYYDLSSNVIIVKKSSKYLGDLFNNFFKKDQYVLEYNDVLKKMYIYYKYTYNKGLSGMTSILNSVKFGGGTIA
jgi:hypothetical protein